MSEADLLTEPERKLLRAIGDYTGLATPAEMAAQLTSRTGTHGHWSHQAVARAAAGLKDLGMIKIERLPNDRHPKMTIYHLVPAGERALEGMHGTLLIERCTISAEHGEHPHATGWCPGVPRG